jgi:manganese-dependent inorganic pyrophosphatase
MKPILITFGLRPDLDALACAIAYAELLNAQGKAAVVGTTGEPHEEVKYVFDRFGFKNPDLLVDADGYDEIILVDKSDLMGIEDKINPEKVIEVIDHRKVHQAEKFPNAKVQIELVGAAATLIAEKFMKDDMAISKNSAILLFSAIISNTLNFKGTLTTARDVSAAAWLNRTAGLPDDFWKEMFLAKSDLSGGKLAERVRGDLIWFEAAGKKVGIAQIEMIGAKKLTYERSDDIVRILKAVKAEMGLDFIFQNIIELEACKNYFLTDNSETEALLHKVLKVTFSGSVAQKPELIMRKQIIPLIKAELEGHH